MLSTELMRRLARKLTNVRAAGNIEYSVLIGLVAISVIGSVAAVGRSGVAMFDGAGNTLIEGKLGESPTVSLSTDLAAIGADDSATLSWTVTNGGTIDSTYRFASGACDALAADGAGPHAYSIASAVGSASHPWTVAEAGCAVEICLSASAQWGSDRQCVQLAIAGPSTTPTNLQFADKTDVEPGAFITSDAATIGGLDVPVGVAAYDGSFSVGGGVGGPWYATGSVADGDILRLGLTAPAGWSETATMSLEVGGATTGWAVTTRAQDTTPDAFDFVNQGSLPLNTQVQSNTVTLTGFDGPLAVAVDGGSDVSINGGAWTPGGAVSAGNTLRLRTLTQNAWNAAKTVTVTVGGTSDSWTVTTNTGACAARQFTWGSYCTGSVGTMAHGKKTSITGGGTHTSCTGGKDGGCHTRRYSGSMNLTCNAGSWQVTLSNCSLAGSGPGGDAGT